MLDGWIIVSSYGSRATRPAASSALMSRSESSTTCTLPAGGPAPSRPRGGKNGPVPQPRPDAAPERFRTYVALGDSFTEGVGDPDPDRPHGVRGWADRVAEAASRRDPDLA